MRKLLSPYVLVPLVFAAYTNPAAAQEQPFQRGDINGNGVKDIADGIYAFNYLFLGGPQPSCLDAADTNDDGSLNLDEGVYLFNYLFLGGPTPPPPFPFCGVDPTSDRLDCRVYPACEDLSSIVVLGRLVLPDGTAAAGATVSDPFGRQVNADDDGEFRYEESVPASGWRGELSCTFSEYSAVIDISNVDDGGVLDVHTVILTLPDGIQRVFISGVVVLPDETPASGATLRITGEQVTASPAGRFREERFLPLHTVLSIIGFVTDDGNFFVGERSVAVGTTEEIDLGAFILDASGDGPFAHRRTDVFSTRPDPTSIAAGDVDGDGVLDLAIANAASVSILRGNGDGSFEESVNVLGISGSNAIALGELNRDGALDFVVAQNGSNIESAFAALFSVDGTLDYRGERFPMMTTSTSAQSVALGDLNGDGVPDVAVAAAASVVVRFATGSGGFGEPIVYPLPTTVRYVAMGDLNADGALDVVAGDRRRVGVFLGDGTGGLRRLANLSSVGNSVTFGDFNRDGAVDLAVTEFDDEIALFMGHGDGRFDPPASFPTGESPVHVAVGDVNGDGLDDAVVANRDSATVSLHLGIGSGALAGPFHVSVGDQPSSLVVDDFNDDGRVDVAVVSTGSDQLHVYLSQLTSE